MKKTIYLATGNAHKTEEFAQMLENTNFELLSAKALGAMPEVDECENTFKGNALLKAYALKELAPANAYILADDSGLCVDALGGAPSIHSARYAGVSGEGADKANNAKLLRELKGIPLENRTARFVCSLALLSPDGKEYIFEGKVEGYIIEEEIGENGFGYDPLFLYKEFNKTTAQIDSTLKHSISHRGKALTLLLDFLNKI
ncbi:MAG: RdgB/HAM1 family non-canonical purine NTP pyrophosphatase [Opitutales bacterium]